MIHLKPSSFFDSTRVLTLTSTALGANGDDAEEHHRHHLGERGFHHVARSEVESRYGSPSAFGCSHPPWAHISAARFAWVRQQRQQQQQHRIRVWVPKFLLWGIYGAYGCPQEEGTFSLLTTFSVQWVIYQSVFVGLNLGWVQLCLGFWVLELKFKGSGYC